MQQELEKMLSATIIVPMEESAWMIPMVVKDKKICGIHICDDLCKLNGACIQDPLPTPLTDEILENVRGKGSLFSHG